MICIPIAAATTDAAIERMERAAPLADLVELRIDQIPGADLKRLLAARHTPVIVTNRRREEGGGFVGTEEERVELLKEAVRLMPENGAYLDSLGWLYFKKDKFSFARYYLLKAIRLEPDPEIYHHLAELYHRIGKIKKAEYYQQKAISSPAAP